MQTMFIKPAPGRIVKDPETLQPLAEDGETKPQDVYWLRRINDGDVIETKPPKVKKEETP